MILYSQHHQMFQKNLTLVMDKVSSMIATTLWGWVPPGFHPIPSALNSPQGFLKALNDVDTLDSTKFLLLLHVIVNLIHSQLYQYVENI